MRLDSMDVAGMIRTPLVGWVWDRAEEFNQDRPDGWTVCRVTLQSEP